MSTLIAVYKSDGTCVGRCDANCYDAKHPACDCICGGMNHGSGEQQATQNTRDHFEQWTERYIQEKGIEGGTSELFESVMQFNLFDVAKAKPPAKPKPQPRIHQAPPVDTRQTNMF